MKTYLPKRYLELVVHLLLVGGAVLVAWSYWQSGGTDRSESRPAIQVDSSVVLSRWRPADQRVFLFVSPTCPYCNRSMDFYARMGHVVDSMQGAGASVALAAVIDGAESPRAQRQVLNDSRVRIDTLLSLEARSLRPVGVTGVPTVAVEKPGRKRPAVWVGLQDSTGEHEILSAVRGRGDHQ